MTGETAPARSGLRLRIATRLFATLYPSLWDAEPGVVTARMKAALAHADELIELGDASQPAAEADRMANSFVSDGNEG